MSERMGVVSAARSTAVALSEAVGAAEYEPVASLLEHSLPGDKLRDINALPVTEIIELRNPA